MWAAALAAAVAGRAVGGVATAERRGGCSSGGGGVAAPRATVPDAAAAASGCGCCGRVRRWQGGVVEAAGRGVPHVFAAAVLRRAAAVPTSGSSRAGGGAGGWRASRARCVSNRFVGELYFFHCTHPFYFLTCKPQPWKPTTGILQSNAAHPVVSFVSMSYSSKRQLRRGYVPG